MDLSLLSLGPVKLGSSLFREANKRCRLLRIERSDGELDGLRVQYDIVLWWWWSIGTGEKDSVSVGKRERELKGEAFENCG